MSETVFFRLLEAEDKAASLEDEIARCNASETNDAEKPSARTFTVEPTAFRQVPGSPFAYWASEELLALFLRFPAFESNGRTALVGLQTSNDFRFIRAWWETDEPVPGSKPRWYPFAKGGIYSPFYADVHLLVDWFQDGAQSWAIYQAHRQRLGGIIKNPSFYFRQGLTWPRRTNGFSVRVLPRGCIFSEKGPSIFEAGNSPQGLLAICGLVNSSVFRQLLKLQLARTELAQSFEIGLVQQTPFPDVDAESTDRLARLVGEAWSSKYLADSVVETSHAFSRPAMLRGDATTLKDCMVASGLVTGKSTERVVEIQNKIDAEALRIYCVSEGALRAVESVDRTEMNLEMDEEESVETSLDGADVKQYTAALLSYVAGVSFGRWDVRRAVVDGRPMPEPFDPLPVCSPGMLQGDDGFPLAKAPEGYPLSIAANGILVDDPGHPSDISAAVRRVFDVLFPQDAEARWQEAGELLGIAKGKPEEWLREEFFPFHVQQYSRSRRKAPIYWQLATPSARYSVWLYLPRLTRDTLFSVLDLVKSKVLHEERQLDTLRHESGSAPSLSQRKALDVQESFVDELRAFRDEVSRVAPLWNPHRDDGVLINFAPLWRLVPHHRAWQKECKGCWDELAAGEYDWSHLAMHLWPERVVPRCREDRSLAIAHGLEDVFWLEDEDGKWQPRPEPTRSIDELVQERTLPAVREARESLLSADTPVTTARRTSAPRARKKRST